MDTINNQDREAAIVALVTRCAQAAGVDEGGQDYAAMLAALHFRIDPSSAWRAVHYGEKVIRALAKRVAA